MLNTMHCKLEGGLLPALLADNADLFEHWARLIPRQTKVAARSVDTATLQATIHPLIGAGTWFDILAESSWVGALSGNLSFKAFPAERRY
jgi:hypothetical protein